MSLYLLDAGLQALEQAGIDAVEQHVLALGGRLRDELVAMGADVLTPAQPVLRAGNLAIVLEDAERAEAELRAAGVLTWWGAGRLRLSVHAYNDDADIARAAAAVRTMLK